MTNRSFCELTLSPTSAQPLLYVLEYNLAICFDFAAEWTVLRSSIALIFLNFLLFGPSMDDLRCFSASDIGFEYDVAPVVAVFPWRYFLLFEVPLAG